MRQAHITDIYDHVSVVRAEIQAVRRVLHCLFSETTCRPGDYHNS